MPLPVREHWEKVVQELAVVGLVSSGPECEEANASLSPATRFLCQLEEDLLSIHFDFTVDSDGDYLLEIDIVMSSLLFMITTYYSVVTDTNKHD